jgi:RNA-binding protein Musashi
MSFSDDDFDDIYGDAPKPVETVPIPEQPQPEVKETAPVPPPSTIEEKENNDKVADVKEVANPIPEIKEDIGPLPEVKENTENAPIKADLSSEIKKMFVGGLNWDTTEDDLRDYFLKYGAVESVSIRKDREGKSKGYGFVDFENASSVEEVLSTRHILDGKVIDPKRAIPKTEQDKVGKIFVGGLPAEIKPKGFKEFFSQFGNVLDAQLMINKNTGMCRGFGFITYDSPLVIEPLVAKKFIDYNGRDVEIKRAEQKASLATPARGRNNQYNNNMPQMDPQQMQQYWSVMQENYRQMAEQHGLDVNQIMQQSQQQMMMMMNMQQNPGMMGNANDNDSNGSIPVIGDQQDYNNSNNSYGNNNYNNNDYNNNNDYGNNNRFDDQRGGFRERGGFRGGRGGFRGGRGRGGFRGGRGGYRNNGQRDYHPYRN